MKFSAILVTAPAWMTLLWSIAASAQQTPPVYCPSAVACDPSELTYIYSKTIDECPPTYPQANRECGIPLPPINIQCMPLAYQLMSCQFDPDGVNVPITHAWRIDSHNATITSAGRVRCNAGELVTVSVDVSNGYDAKTAQTAVVCPASSY